MKNVRRKEQNEGSWATRPTIQKQSTRRKRRDIVIESSGNLQVSRKRDTYYYIKENLINHCFVLPKKKRQQIK